MLINTKDVNKGIIEINGEQIKEGMLITELENILNTKLENIKENCGYSVLTELNEDEKTTEIYVWFSNGKIKTVEIQFSKFKTENEAAKYLDSWLINKGVTEFYGSDKSNTYYKTETGVLIPHIIINYSDNNYAIRIILRDGERPERKFKSIKKNKNNSKTFIINSTEYKIQRVPYKELKDLPHLGNFLGDGAFSLAEMDKKYTKDNRIEIMYFYISKIENNIETIIGVADFTYLAVWDTYKTRNLFDCLDFLAEEWGIVAYAINKFECELNNKKEISPYILVCEEIHNEIPYNEALAASQ